MDFPIDRPVRPSWLTVPASHIYEILVDFHQWRFEKIPGRVGRVPVPVISVGNLTVGGTGKTPCVVSLVALLRDILQEHHMPGVPAVLTRGYGRQVRSMRRLGPKPAESVDWQEFGDEPLLLHQLLPKIPIIIEPDRVKGARAAVRDHQSPVLVLDDGFQFRALHKDLEIVLVDGQNPVGNGHLLPAGPLREPVDALQRADIIVGVGSGDGETVAAAQLADRYNKRFLQAFLRPGKPKRFSARKTDQPPEKVVLLSGIARPERFRRSALEAGFRVLEHCHFRDHHPFSQGDIASISTLTHKVGAEAILTTGKDAVRLVGLTFGLPVWILPVEFCWKEPEGITEQLARIFENSSRKSADRK